MLAERLRQAVAEARRENDLPDYLAEQILTIAARLDAQPEPVPEVETLLEQLPLYDTFAQTGYLGIGVTHLILEKTVKQIEDQLKD